MKEQRITVTINADGKMSAKTNGIKGETCIEELEALLSWQNWMMFSIHESIMRKIRGQPRVNQQNNVLEGIK